ncbi:hypothetical protein [Brevundimonas sp.]|uniref:hypothetical protein n=1 Tax=Brevundimonas sp. TaxID=1871086 RepID=UPI002ED91174
MIAALLSALLISTAPQAQAAAPVPSDQADAAVRLEDVEVTGRRLDTMIRDFIDEVAAPNYNRGLARWSGSVCVGAANLSNDAAQYLVDRVSTVAEDLGLQPGAPGCTPNILIVATEDPQALSQDLIDKSPRAFRAGGAGMDRGGAELRRFAQSDLPVRWWQVSMPVDSETGMRATRLPSEGFDAGDDLGRPSQIRNYAPNINIFSASRLTTQIHDNLFRTVIVVDVTKTDRVSINQLADYIAMVSFAQIDPTADTSRYASILNLFSDPQAASSGLTDWDKAYLNGLYDAQRTQKNLRAGRTEIAASIHRAHDRLTSDAED